MKTVWTVHMQEFKVREAMEHPNQASRMKILRVTHQSPHYVTFWSCLPQSSHFMSVTLYLALSLSVWLHFFPCCSIFQPFYRVTQIRRDHGLEFLLALMYRNGFLWFSEGQQSAIKKTLIGGKGLGLITFQKKKSLHSVRWPNMSWLIGIHYGNS